MGLSMLAEPTKNCGKVTSFCRSFVLFEACCKGMCQALTGESCVELSHGEAIRVCLVMHAQVCLADVRRFLDLRRMLEIPQIYLYHVDKGHHFIMVLLEGVPVDLWFVRLGHHLEEVVDVFRVVERVKVVGVFSLEAFVVGIVEVDDPVEVVVPRFDLVRPGPELLILNLLQGLLLFELLLLLGGEAFAPQL